MLARSPYTDAFTRPIATSRATVGTNDANPVFLAVRPAPLSPR